MLSDFDLHTVACTGTHTSVNNIYFLKNLINNLMMHFKNLRKIMLSQILMEINNNDHWRN